MINIGNLRILDVTSAPFAVAFANAKRGTLLNPLRIDVRRKSAKKSPGRGVSNR
jgi:hypothetical protein